MKDTIFIRDMLFYGYHGVIPEENRLGQRFKVSIELECELEEAAIQDDLTLSVDYGEVYNMTRTIMEGTTRKLVESIAVDIASAVLGKFPAVLNVRVRVEKPEAPIPGIFSTVGVVIERNRV